MVGKRAKKTRRRVAARSKASFRLAEVARTSSPISSLCIKRPQRARMGAISNGRRSTRQSRKAPPRTNTMLASHTPSDGGSLPWRAKDTPMSEAE